MRRAVRDEFRHRLFMALPRPRRAARAVRRPLAVVGAAAARSPWFRRADHLGDPRAPLRRGGARRWSRSARARRPRGPIRLLTHLRYFGHCFNPVSFYYCFDAAGERRRRRSSPRSPTRRGASATPTCCRSRERGRPRHGVAGLRAASRKALHVSPLMGMDHVYDLARDRAGASACRCTSSPRPGRRTSAVFDATLVADAARAERAADGAACSRRYPLLTLRIAGPHLRARAAAVAARRHLPPPPAAGRCRHERPGGRQTAPGALELREAEHRRARRAGPAGARAALAAGWSCACSRGSAAASSRSVEGAERIVFGELDPERPCGR